ncbi:MAG: FAD-dependent thymidylate synthase [Candidatus Micrarchaeota archaeon]|nr:FAD-dependent thymidylate synthase [Candidatus Micrarchaeota archaeon]MDE1847812.1 FAD-dependent thymidylate synthase [Candidatus Micrarchaeota archaeon]MDE1864382.1 FAD-dependent thymidylate synthase [Candidatus Micrarchaeota archaeon]
MATDYTLFFGEGAKGVVVENFSDEDEKALGSTVTNLEDNIFAWKLTDDFTPEQAGALLSRYSRTSLTSRRLFIKEFYPNKSRGREFFDAWLVDYGDDSIQEMAGGLPVSCEYVSNVAVKDIEDCRFGSYIEKSTRYVAFDKKLPNGDYMFYKDPQILASRHAESYLDLMGSLFDSYSRHMEGMVKYIADTNRIEDIGFRIGNRLVRINEMNSAIEEQFGITEADLQKSYENAIKANALDFLRDFLPMSTLTHVGISMDARSYENMINKMLASQLLESRFIAKRLCAELKKLVPSLVKRVEDSHGIEMQEFFRERNESAATMVSGISKGIVSKGEGIELREYAGEGTANPDVRAQTIIATMIIYKFSRGTSISQAAELAAKMGDSERKSLINTYVGSRKNRRHKPGRAFENLDYTFDLNGRIGIYRDIQRHRIGTQERQNFGVELGYDTRSAFKEVGIEDDYKQKMSEVTKLYNKIFEKMPHQAQYVVTLGFNIRWYYKLNARQLYHLCELRSTHQGHPDYRKLVQQMAMKVKAVHPSVMEPMIYLDMSEKTLGRLDSEIRMAVKKSQLNNTKN